MTAPDLPRLTPAQRRALEWLPADGAYRFLDKANAASVYSLGKAHPDLAHVMRAPISIPTSAELTQTGIEARRRLIESPR